MQGLTEAAFRHFHAEIYGIQNIATYFTPFARVEKGIARIRDMRDISSTLNGNHKLIPQIIFRNAYEFNTLVDSIVETGHTEIDLNMGCPFPPQVRKGRGAGILANANAIEEIGNAIITKSGIRFSAKIRLGISFPDEWQKVLPVLNKIPFSHITVHPRTAGEQYKGALHMDEFARICTHSAHPVIFNGGITAPQDINNVLSTACNTAGVMIGRGILMRPSLVNEWIGGAEWPRPSRTEFLLALHKAIFQHYENKLCGETHLLQKIKPFWEYSGVDFEQKQIKRIIKSTTLKSYSQALAMLT